MLFALALLSVLLVNYLVDTLPRTRRLARPDWWPLSAGALGAYFSRPRVWLSTLAALVLAYGLVSIPIADWPLWQLTLVLIYFAVVFIIDLEHRAVLHEVSWAGALLCGTIGWLRHGPLDTLLGGVGGFVILFTLYWQGEQLGRWLARRRGQDWEEVALGFGDVNLAGVIGLLVGWPAVLGALMLALIFGGLFSLGHIAFNLARRRYSAFAAIPYAPFLVLGAVGLILLRAFVAP
jgi:prepilin signal peptidase PulO-like enzyme (type II secretory pathway)